MEEKRFTSIQGFIELIQSVKDWPEDQPRWFRGEPVCPDTSLLPRLFRNKVEEINADPDRAKEITKENHLLQNFRARAPSFTPGPVPPKRETADW